MEELQQFQSLAWSWLAALITYLFIMIHMKKPGEYKPSGALTFLIFVLLAFVFVCSFLDRLELKELRNSDNSSPAAATVVR